MLTQGCEHCQGLGEKVEPKCRHKQKLKASFIKVKRGKLQ